MVIHEVELTEEIMKELIRLSEIWEKEDSCYGYKANGSDDIEGNRVFLAERSLDICSAGFADQKTCGPSCRTARLSLRWRNCSCFPHTVGKASELHCSVMRKTHSAAKHSTQS